MLKIMTFFTLGLLGALLVTACAQPTPEPNDFPSPPPSYFSTPAPTADVSTSVVSGTVVSGTQVATSLPLTEIVPTPTSETAPALTPVGQIIVTLDDRGKTIALKTDESFLLQLGEMYTWDISISDQTVLSRVLNIAVVRGAQGVYIAHQPGTVTLTATGDPTCRQSKPPCMMPSIALKITVVVK